MRRKIYHEIAVKLQQTIQENPSYELPAIVTLAGQWRVSYQTMWKAVNSLARGGILVNRPGGKPFVASKSRDPQSIPPHLMNSAEKLAARIHDRIVIGEYEAGKPLPKADFFSRTEGISRLTVAQAMSLLRSSHLVYKARHRWIAGPAPAVSRSSSLAASQGPVALILFSDENAWGYILQNLFMNKFFAPFTSETLGHGITLAPALLHAPSDGSLGLPSEKDGVRAAIRSLGKRYQGTLLVGIYPKIDRYDEWITMLSAFGKPVAWFDNADAGGYLTRQFLGLRGGYYRLHIDENAAAALAVDLLAKAGHQTVGIHGSDLADWAKRRTDLMIEHAAGCSPTLAISVAGPSEDLWDLRFAQEMHHVTSAIAHESGFDPGSMDDESAAQQKYRRLLKERCRSLAALLSDHAPTALIGLNDRMAREYYFWLKALGIAVPRDISILSFDNTIESLLFPLSSIDSGLARLGYCAAHIFIGDIPIRADRQGNISGACTLADRGSLAGPGRTTVNRI